MKFIPVCSYDNYIDAHIMLGKLQEQGINCWLKDEHTATITPFLSNLIGGIKLMVPESQAERAIQIINEPANE